MDFTIKTMAEYAAEGKAPEVLFFVGCAGSFDDRAKKITKALCKILHKVGVEFAVLGQEESCNGDPAKRAGNEFIFQMMALTNIEIMNGYGVKKIVTACPHCFINFLSPNSIDQLGYIAKVRRCFQRWSSLNLILVARKIVP